MIAVTDLRFAYPGSDRPLLEGLDFSIAPGEVYGLLGPSGAGKSTTQKILLGLQTGFSGAVTVFGAPVGTLGRRFYQRIGVSFELPTLYLRLTARENLALFAALYERAPLSPIEALGLVDLTEAADQKVETFSKGMKMRLNLCRALLNDPELVFLDEPTTGQDPSRARATRALIGTLKARGKTVFLTTHNMAEAAEVCDRVGFLAGGRIAVEGAPLDLMRTHGRREVEVTRAAPDGSTRTLAFPLDGLDRNADFQAAIARDVLSIHTREASLDDIFVAATAADVAPPLPK